MRKPRIASLILLFVVPAIIHWLNVRDRQQIEREIEAQLRESDSQLATDVAAIRQRGQEERVRSR